MPILQCLARSALRKEVRDGWGAGRAPKEAVGMGVFDGLGVVGLWDVDSLSSWCQCAVRCRRSERPSKTHNKWFPCDQKHA